MATYNGTNGVDSIQGSSSNDTINGLGGNDNLYGEGGTDTVNGGDGNDIIYGGGLTSSGQVVVGGTIYMTDDVADYLNGDGGDDRIQAGRGDVVNGGLGTDWLGAFFVSATAGVTVNFSSVWTGGSFSLGSGADLISGSNMEGLEFAFGSIYGDTLTSGSLTGSVSTLYGLGGADFLIGGAGTDRLYSNTSPLVTDADADQLYGLDGNDYLLGGIGDYLDGGSGTDILYLDLRNASGGVSLDFAPLLAGATGTIFGTTLVSFEDIAGVLGTAYDDTIDTSADFYTTNLQGEGGNDLLIGNGGANTLSGGDGNDTLDAGDGADQLTGGAGHDSLWGGAGNDVLDGGDGGDLLDGNDGIDTASYLAASAWVEVDLSWLEDQNTRGAGWDTLMSVENVTGSAYDDILKGDGGANLLNGSGGADMLYGREGADVLNGGSGNDSFVFDTALGGGNVDTIQGFAAGADKIGLDSAVFSALAPGALPAGAFVIGAAAADAADRVIYNSSTGALSYDADGTGAGAAVQFATLSTGLALTASDFLVI